MGVQAVLAVLLLFTATVKAQGGVTFWRNTFTMTCPKEGTWHGESLNITETKEATTMTLTYKNNMKEFYCTYQDDTTQITYYFYVKGKVCDNCYELDAMLFWLAITVDVIGTVLVMMIIYRCTKQKSSTGLTPASKPPARQGGRAPPVPSPDYELLNPRTISQDAYSVVNRMG
ncbi:T-cell surface glycoprotein CD3 epsilon chain-like isoform X2 [Micropterus salmoides]|uniref:T-cell surface glycoprotein CD3 epsilon chain-like isoform X2 n=1 Tax=Micropterus salmoides TaxID=27706 RepID=UPI0018EADB94|nr:T-cell surface glycoprotein CD3 epsilon chain-like isoform X2 [Micropterus salmoides]